MLSAQTPFRYSSITGGQSVTRLLDNGWILSYPWDLLAANEIIMASLVPLCLGEIEPNVTRKGAVIRSGTYIVGPVINSELYPVILFFMLTFMR